MSYLVFYRDYSNYSTIYCLSADCDSFPRKYINASFVTWIICRYRITLDNAIMKLWITLSVSMIFSCIVIHLYCTNVILGIVQWISESLSSFSSFLMIAEWECRFSLQTFIGIIYLFTARIPDFITKLLLIISKW